MSKLQQPATPGPINLTAERLRRGLSVAALAKDIGLSYDVLAGAERGTRPQPANALKIAEYFGVDVLVQWPLPESDQEAEAA